MHGWGRFSMEGTQTRSPATPPTTKPMWQFFFRSLQARSELRGLARRIERLALMTKEQLDAPRYPVRIDG